MHYIIKTSRFKGKNTYTLNLEINLYDQLNSKLKNIYEFEI